MVEIKKISTHLKTRTGTTHPKATIQSTTMTNGVISLCDKPVGDISVGNTTKGHAQYCIIYGKGSNRKSETKHCSEDYINNYKKELEKAGY